MNYITLVKSLVLCVVTTLLACYNGVADPDPTAVQHEEGSRTHPTQVDNTLSMEDSVLRARAILNTLASLSIGFETTVQAEQSQWPTLTTFRVTHIPHEQPIRIIEHGYLLRNAAGEWYASQVYTNARELKRRLKLDGIHVQSGETITYEFMVPKDALVRRPQRRYIIGELISGKRVKALYKLPPPARSGAVGAEGGTRPNERSEAPWDTD